MTRYFRLDFFKKTWH